MKSSLIPLCKSMSNFAQLMVSHCQMIPCIVRYAVKMVSQFISSPCSVHWAAVVHFLRYLCGTLFPGLLLSSSPNIGTSSIYSDADWAGDFNNRKSITGLCIFLRDTLISWKSKKRRGLSRSTSEAEYRVMPHTATDII